MGFRSVSREQIDETRVTLSLVREQDGTLLGRVQTLALNEQGGVEMMSTELPIQDAIALAVQLADFKEQDVDVFDPEGLWTDDPGRLN